MADKKFQVLFVEYDPTAIPFVSESEGVGIQKHAIYVRHFTSSELANYEDIQRIISRRMSTGFTSQIDLREHISQLRALYDVIPQTLTQTNLFKPLVATLNTLVSYEPNPKYPEEGLEDFILRMIEEKKSRIEQVLNLPER